MSEVECGFNLRRASGRYECWTAAAREQRQNLGESCFGSKAIAGTKRVDLAVLDELVGPADANDGNGEAHFVESFNNR